MAEIKTKNRGEAQHCARKFCRGISNVYYEAWERKSNVIYIKMIKTRQERPFYIEKSKEKEGSDCVL